MENSVSLSSSNFRFARLFSISSISSFLIFFSSFHFEILFLYWRSLFEGCESQRSLYWGCYGCKIQAVNIRCIEVVFFSHRFSHFWEITVFGKIKLFESLKVLLPIVGSMFTGFEVSLPSCWCRFSRGVHFRVCRLATVVSGDIVGAYKCKV